MPIDDDKGKIQTQTRPGGGDHQSQTIGAGKVGSPQQRDPVTGRPPIDPVTGKEVTDEEVPLTKQAAPEALPGMPENSTATPGFEDTPPDPTKQAQAEQEAADAKKASAREGADRP